MSAGPAPRAREQQVEELVDEKHPTVLEGSVMEGAAELIAELIAGEVSNLQPFAVTRGREKEIETAFVADRDKSDLSDWLFNYVPGKPGDLGCWVGYRIAKAYYRNAPDKRQAFREIVQITDPKAFLAKSGWYPGIRLE